MDDGNTGVDDAHNPDPQIAVEDRRLGRYGLIFLNDIDNDTFRGLTMGARLVYMALTIFASKNTRECYPSQAYLAGVVGMSRGNVNKAIRALCEAKMLTKSYKKRKGKNSLVIYTLLPAPRDP